MKFLKMLAAIISALIYAFSTISLVADFFSGALLTGIVTKIAQKNLLHIAPVAILALGAYSINTSIDYLLDRYENASKSLIVVYALSTGLSFYILTAFIAAMQSNKTMWLLLYSAIFAWVSLYHKHTLTKPNYAVGHPLVTYLLHIKIPFIMIYIVIFTIVYNGG